MANILIIDDDAMLCEMLCRHIRYLNYDADYAVTLEDGFGKLNTYQFDIVFLDVHLPDGNGLKALPDIRRMAYEPEIMIITGEGDPDGAELAISSGAWDYIEKPMSMNKITLQLTRVLQYRKEKSAKSTIRAIARSEIAGNSDAMRAVMDFVSQAADSDGNVLITGETGTGKELVCRAIHNNSWRVGRNLVVVDCAALPETLIESTLFGHVKGAFTGADNVQIGLVEQAHEGTLFLDEIGELSLSAQKAFLRVLQERRFRPVGHKKEKSSNFRLIAATNQNLEAMVDEGRFRRDLLFRINTLNLELLPLQAHPEDIRDITMYHVNRMCQRYRMGTKGVSPDFIETLESCPWPGNVRELVNTIEKALMTAREAPTLFARHLPVHIRVHMARRSVKSKGARDFEHDRTQELEPLKAFRKIAADEAEKHYLQKLIAICNGDVKQACHMAELSRNRLYELCKKHRLSLS